MVFPYKRVLIVGCGGSGKSTLARAMGGRFGLPVVHLDRLWWLPGWQNVTREEFDEGLAKALARPEWIIDGNYARTFAERLARADFCVYLDIDTETCMRGALDRARRYAGKTRPDMTEGCEERMDAEFEQWIREFSERVRPAMLRQLEESGVAHRLFTTREAAFAWMDSFEYTDHPMQRSAEAGRCAR